MKNNMELSERLKLLREKNKLTKRELCKRINVVYSTYNNWEINASKPQINDLCIFRDYALISLIQNICMRLILHSIAMYAYNNARVNSRFKSPKITSS